MGRVFHSGFETAQTDVFGKEWTSFGTATIDTINPRSGTYSLRNANTGRASWADLLEPEAYARLYIRLDGEPTSRREFANIGSATHVISLYLNIDRTIGLENTGALLGTSAAVIPVGQWIRVEFRALKGAGTGAAELRIEGVTEVTASNLQAGTADWSTFVAGFLTSPGTASRFDDIAVNNVAGTVNNSWPGEGGIVLIKPTADTATINWTAQNGGSHFAEIDDLPAGGDGTTYIKTTSTTLNLEDRWEFSDLSAPVVSSAQIKAICFGVAGGGTGTTARTAKFQARDANNNTVDGSDVDWNLNGWKSIYPILTRNQTWEATPAALTPSYVNGILGSAIDTNTNNREIRWTAVWASVEYLNPTIPHRLALLGVGH